MYFVLFGTVTCGTVDCTFVRTDAWLDFSRDLLSLWSKFFQDSRCGDCSLVTTARTPSFSKKQMPTSQINVAAEVSQEFLRKKERRSPKHHTHTQYSIDLSDSNTEYGQSPGFQCLIVTKTEGHGLLELDPLRTQTPIFV